MGNGFLFSSLGKEKILLRLKYYGERKKLEPFSLLWFRNEYIKQHWVKELTWKGSKIWCFSFLFFPSPFSFSFKVLNHKPTDFQLYPMRQGKGGKRKSLDNYIAKENTRNEFRQTDTPRQYIRTFQTLM